MSIGRKFTAWIISILLITTAASVYFFYYMELEEETKKLELIGNLAGHVIEESLSKNMLNRDIATLSDDIQKIKKGAESINRIWLVNGEGVVKAGTDPDMLGMKLTSADRRCQQCHAPGKKGVLLDKGRTFRWVQPVRNKPECHKCHNPQTEYNGVIILDFSLNEIKIHIRNEILGGSLIIFAAIAVISFFMVIISNTLVSRRLARVITRIKEFKDGNYNVRIPLDGNDEITKLQGDFNEMAEAIKARDGEKGELLGRIKATNEQLYHEITGRIKTEKEIHRNYDTQSVINALLRVSLENIPLDEIMSKALDLILSIPWLTLESRGGIFLVEDEPDKLVMKAQKGLSGYIQEECALVPFGKCLCGQAALTQEFQFSDAVDKRHEVHYEGITPHGHYCVPILFSGKTLGVIALYLKEGHQKDQKEVEFLEAVANALAGIIQRKIVEEERVKLINDLQITLGKVSHSQKMWQETFDSIGDLISIHDRDFNIIMVNRAFAGYFGLSPRDVINKKCYEIFHHGDSPAANCPHLITLNENRPATAEFTNTKTGRIFLISTFPFYFHDAQFHGSIHIAKDITEEREKEMRLIMTERLASLGQMASGIAHEINNPLAAIAGCAEGLYTRVKKGRYDPELFENYLKIIEEEIIRCKGITTSMLSFVRKTAYEKKEVSINDSIDKAVEMIGFQGRFKAVEIIRNYKEGIPIIYGNESELRQVFMSIITNALDAMEDSGTLTLETGIASPPTPLSIPPLSMGDSAGPEERDGGTLEKGEEKAFVFINISDTGPGIPPDNISKIFNPFFTTKSEKGGTGLGLSIANKIISNHNGSLDIKTDVGRGTTFKITLPV